MDEHVSEAFIGIVNFSLSLSNLFRLPLVYYRLFDGMELGLGEGDSFFNFFSFFCSSARSFNSTVFSFLCYRSEFRLRFR